MIIDFHTHAFPDALAVRTIPKLAKTAGAVPYTNATVSDNQDKMNQWGVDYAVVLNIATRPGNQKKVNNWAAETQQATENLFCFGSVHPDAEDAIEEIYRIKELGLKGIKFHPDYQNFVIDEDKMTPLYDTIAKLKLPIIFHCGYDPISPDCIHAPSKKVAKVVNAYPEMTVIAAHMGGMCRYEESEEYLVGNDLYLDTSMSAQYMSQEQFNRMVKKHGADKILFATDCPWSSAVKELEMVRAAGLTEEEEAAILFKNAFKLLTAKTV